MAGSLRGQILGGGALRISARGNAVRRQGAQQRRAGQSGLAQADGVEMVAAE
jgi:hypothetical protein